MSCGHTIGVPVLEGVNKVGFPEVMRGDESQIETRIPDFGLHFNYVQRRSLTPSSSVLRERRSFAARSSPTSLHADARPDAGLSSESHARRRPYRFRDEMANRAGSEKDGCHSGGPTNLRPCIRDQAKAP